MFDVGRARRAGGISASAVLRIVMTDHIPNGAERLQTRDRSLAERPAAQHPPHASTNEGTAPALGETGNCVERMFEQAMKRAARRRPVVENQSRGRSAGRHAERGHRLADEVFAEHRAQRGAPVAKAQVVGTLCENNDWFAKDRDLPDARVGDLFVIHDVLRIS